MTRCSGQMASFFTLLVAFVLWVPRATALGVKERPIAKVVRLLKEMHSNLQKEGEEDQKTYDTMACWCETNEKAKTKAVADGTQKDKRLTALIPELAATSSQLKVEIQQLNKELKENQGSLAETTELRAKELAEFRIEETDGVASINGMKNALAALSKPHASLTQEVLLQVDQAVSHKSEHALRMFFSASQRRAVANMLQKRSSSHLQGSDEILGIMKGMKESFEQNLANAQKEEAEGVATFNQVKTAKDHEISAAIKQIQNKQVELSDTDDKNAESKEELDDTRKQVTADNAFLRDLQQRCGSMDKEFVDRQKVRTQEMSAVSEALKILTDDDAKETLNRSTGFLQIKQTLASSTRSGVLALLRAAGQRLGNPRLSMLALTLKDDVFAKIKVILDDLVKKLHDEQQDDVSQRDSCIDDINTNEKQLAEKKSLSKDAATSIEELTLAVTKLREEIVAAHAEIDEMKKEMLSASQNRENENKDFQMTVTDQRATQQIVAKALDKLKAFYDASAFVQVGQAPPPGFAGDYKKSEGASGVTVMMQHVIDESKEVEANAVKAESDAQEAYEQFQKDSNGSINALNKSITDKEAAVGKADAEKIRAKEDLKSLTADIKSLGGLKRQLHSQCDFLLKNFEVRQSARTEEIEALEEAKAFMNGAAP